MDQKGPKWVQIDRIGLNGKKWTKWEQGGWNWTEWE